MHNYIGIDLGVKNIRLSIPNLEIQSVKQQQHAQLTLNVIQNYRSQILKYYHTVYFQNNHQLVFGLIPQISSIIDIAYFIGKKFKDIKNINHYYYHTLNNDQNDNIIIECKTSFSILKFYPEVLIAAIFKAILLRISSKSHQNYNNFVYCISVNEYLNNSYRLGLKYACLIADINSYYFVSCCHSMAAYYTKEQGSSLSKTIGVIDFGDTGFTLGIYRITKGIVQVQRIQTKQFGGNHITKIIVDYISKKIQAEKGITIWKNFKLMASLNKIIQQVKLTLCFEKKAYIRLSGLPNDTIYGCIITLDQFQQLIDGQIQQIISLIKQMYANLSIEQLIIGGGSSKLPLFNKKLTNLFGNKNLILAQQCWYVKGLVIIISGQITFLDVSNFQLRMQADAGFTKVILKKNQSIPTRRYHNLIFPYGQLQYNFQLYQNDVNIINYLIPYKPKSQPLELVIDIDRNKMITTYLTSNQGQIQMQQYSGSMPTNQQINAKLLLSQYKIKIYDSK